ncbi:jg18973 [Pararge aegeria aegeria]|uniref:peptidylprolyl isomerase n=1 Tax=Pararge aegeria aegeria TaxID=348720 RepID=A0A8S4SRU2_9NEOP|nr:jg18973 [Pararge aegeria aegeria]
MMYVEIITSALIALPITRTSFTINVTWLALTYRPWRLLLQVISIPGIIGVIGMLFLKESPKFLLIELEGKLPDGKVFDARTVTFVLGDGLASDICEGVERALEKFNQGEKSKLTIQPKYGFKSEGNKKLGVPPNSVVEYVVRLVSFEKSKEVWQMDTEEKLEQSNVLKESGTNYFKESKFQLAIKKYKKVVTLLDDIPSNTFDTEEHKTRAKALLVSVHLNLALVYLKVTPPHHYEAKDHATKALNLDPNNVKGLFRRGQALLALGEADQALKDFEKVVEAEPQNKVTHRYVKIRI